MYYKQKYIIYSPPQARKNSSFLVNRTKFALIYLVTCTAKFSDKVTWLSIARALSWLLLNWSSISNWKCSISTWNLAMGFGCDYSSWNYQYSRANPERFKAELIGYWNEAARIMTLYACMVSTEWFGLDLLPPVCFLNIASNSAPSVLLLFKRNTKNHQILAFCRNTSNFCCFCQIPPTFQKQPTTRSV